MIAPQPNRVGRKPNLKKTKTAKKISKLNRLKNTDAKKKSAFSIRLIRYIIGSALTPLLHCLRRPLKMAKKPKKKSRP